MAKSKGNDNNLASLAQRLGISFRDGGLLTTALTHRSYSAEHGGESNERLEFLGDSVLDLLIAEELYRRHPEMEEGMLSINKAALVNGEALAQIALRWDVGALAIMSHGEESAGGRHRRAMLADTVEAIIGAYYLDAGLDACREFVLREIPVTTADTHGEAWHDYKTELQEYCQSRYHETPVYLPVREEGPSHVRTFVVATVFRGGQLGEGSGKSKKEAEQAAAKAALVLLREM
ncbi:MAG: ribonuclease III [bacterium]